MNIVVIPFGFPTKDNQSSGIFIWEQCNALYNAGHNVVVLDATGRNYKAWLSEECLKYRRIRKDGIIVYALNHPAILSGRLPRIAASTYGLYLKYLWKRLVADGFKPDLIHAHFTTYSGYCSIEYAKEYGIPLIVTEHYSLFRERNLQCYMRRILKRTIEEADAFICVSNTLKADIQKHLNFSQDIEVIPNMIDPTFTYHTPIHKDYFMFFSAGNLIPLKKMDLLIRAFAVAFQDHSSVKLEIAGAGEQNQFLQELIIELKMQNQIRLLGRIAREHMVRKIAECDAFVMVSETETFGIVYREAMAVGKPIIASKNGGAEEDWDDRQGILIPVNDLEATSSALIRMKENIHKYNPAEISNRCHSLYSAEVVVAKLEMVYKRAQRKRKLKR